MDKRLKKALDFSNFRIILSTKQKNLKVLMNNKLLIVYKNNLFKIDKELILFISTLLSKKESEFVFLDTNDAPILITDLQEFYNVVYKRYKNVINQYYKDYQKLNKIRNIKKVIDWDE